MREEEVESECEKNVKVVAKGRVAPNAGIELLQVFGYLFHWGQSFTKGCEDRLGEGLKTLVVMEKFYNSKS